MLDDDQSKDTIADLRATLSKTQENLRILEAENSDLFSRLVKSKSALKRERYINELASSYIPDDLQDEYMASWPCGQIEWTGSSSPVRCDT